MTHQTGQKLRKSVHFRIKYVSATESVSPYQLSTHAYHFITCLQLVWVITKTRKITRFQHIFSEFARKLHFLKNKTTYLQKVYAKCFYILYTLSFPLYPRFSRMFSQFACGKGGFITFVFFWPTTISPRNASLGSS